MTSKNVEDYKKIKAIDVDTLRQVLTEKQKFGDHEHVQRKEIVNLRGDVATKLIWEADKASASQHQRRLQLLKNRK